MIKNTEDWIHQERVKKIMMSNHESSVFYIEDGKVVMTESYHIMRGSCCGNKCLHCPYEPRYEKGNTKLQ